MWYIKYIVRKNGKEYNKVSFPFDNIEFAKRFYKKNLETSKYQFFIALVKF